MADSKTSNNSFLTALWLLKLVFGFVPKLFVALFASQVLANVAPFVEQKYLSHLIDSLIQSYSQHNNVWTSAFIAFLVVRLIRTIFTHLQRIINRVIETKTSYKLRVFYLNRTANLDYQQYEDPHISKLMSKVNEEYAWRSRQMLTNILDLFVSIISFSTIIILLLPNYWYIAIILLIGEIPSMFSDRYWQKVDWQTFNHYNELSRPGWDAAWQLVTKRFIAELKIHHGIDWLMSKFTLPQDEFTQARIRNRQNRFFPDLIASVFSLTASGICMYLVINDINQGLLTVGMFTFYLGIIRNTGDYFGSILNNLVSIGEQSLHINNFRTIVELPRQITNGGLKSGLSPLPKIEFKNVSFRYPGQEKFVYRHLNLVINPGEEIALVGPNGAGKSTLIKLLCRFYDPTEGQIIVNGHDLREYQLDYWYQHLAYLSQEFNAYDNLNLLENVTIGQKIDLTRLTTALQKADANRLAKQLPQGVNTMLSQKYEGKEPSWGQWQKIAIARIFYRDSPIMILDEPTASIDAVAESKIFSRLYQQLNKKTLIIVSHRFSTVRNAQRIVVIDKGKIVEQGSHAELLKHNGLYARSFKLQAKGYN